MSKRKCDNCNKEVDTKKEHILRAPDKYCEHCKSETFAEYNFCDKNCVIEWLQKN